MPTIGWFEILIVVGIAIVVLGPKDFPIMLKKAGSWIGTGSRRCLSLCGTPCCRSTQRPFHLT